MTICVFAILDSKVVLPFVKKNGNAVVEEDSVNLISGNNSSGSNNSSSTEYSPNKCILTNNKLRTHVPKYPRTQVSTYPASS